MNATLIEEAHRCGRALATRPPRLPSFSCLCRTFTAQCEIATRHPFDDEGERRRERRHMPLADNDVCAWMVEPCQSQRGSPRTDRPQPSGDDQARESPGLQPIRSDAVPLGLRHREVGCSSWVLPDERLQRAGWFARHATYGRQAGALATCQKNANGGPATEQGMSETFRHGTKCATELIEKQDFVPPRYKTPYFRGSHRSATGHLSRFAIYRGISRC